MSKTRELLFSVTVNDCTFTPYRGSGAGGQKKNKTSSAMRCTHNDSGAVGECEQHREQSLNKKEAFRKMAETQKFKDWLELEAKKRTGELAILEAKIEKEMKKIKIEGKFDGKWVEVKEGDLRND